MIALLLLAAAAATKPVPFTPAASAGAKRTELALRGKMAKWRGTWRIQPEGVSCATRVSTADPRLDTIGCRAIQACYAPKVPALAAIDQGDGDEAAKKAKIAATLSGAQACVARNRSLAIQVIAGTRPPPEGIR